ncbi:MAG: OprO/OprP family phosphate-selective porin, partial [Alistipes sp.]|nr:OprO/OprP family phosphate-selective porin [Alistipes sp.]
MKSLLTSLGLLALLAGQAQTQSDTTTLAELSTKVEALERKSSTWDKIVAHLPRVSGYIQLRYQWDDANESSFSVRRARLDFKGDIAPKLDYRLQVEFASKVKIVDA